MSITAFKRQCCEAELTFSSPAMKEKMNTAGEQRIADNGIRKNSFGFDPARDIFLYSTVIRTKTFSDSGSSGSRHSNGSF